MHNKTPKASGGIHPGASEPSIVLVMGVGKTAPVITETVWALAHRNPPVIPHRLIVIIRHDAARFRDDPEELLQDATVLAAQ